MALVCAMVFFGGVARSEDLLDLYRLALDKDPVFLGEKHKHAASPETLRQAYSELVFTVNADGSFQRRRQEINDTSVTVYGRGLSKYPADIYTITLVQPLLRLGSIVRVKQALAQVAQADLAFEASRQDLIMRLVEAYFNALEARDNLDFANSELTAVKKHHELAQGRYSSGLSPITDFHDAKSRLAEVMATTVDAQSRLADALEGLAEMTGTAPQSLAGVKPMLSAAPEDAGLPVPGAGQIPGQPSTVVQANSTSEAAALEGPNPDDMEQWIAAALKDNLEVAVQRKAVEVARAEVHRQKSAHAPTLSAVGRVTRDNEGGSLFGGESDVTTTEGMLQFNIPIFQGFYVVSKTREALALYKAAQENLEKEVRAVKRLASASFLGVKAAVQNVEAFHQSMISNQIALEAKREGLKSGLLPILPVLDAERDLHRARQGFAKAHYAFLLNSLRLKKAVGGLGQDDLVHISQYLQ